MLPHYELRQWLAQNQRTCPVCGKGISEWDTLHHLFVRRMKKYDKLLWHRINIVLVCAACHVPEAPQLNHLAAVQKFWLGFTPDDVREWIASIPFKVSPGLPSWFIGAEDQWQKEYDEWQKK